jgi:hypothetical protein
MAVTSIAEVSLSDQIAELKREIKLRQRVYPRLIAQEKLTRQDAQRHMTNIIAALHTLETVSEMRLTIAQTMT